MAVPEIKDIFEGDYGFAVEITIEQDGAALDISDFTDYQMIFVDPTGATAAKTAALKTDGTDGIITYTMEEDVLDMAGIWKIYGRVSSASAESTSRPGYMPVSARPD